MGLTDPTSGSGYAFGAKLTSAHMTTISGQQPRALDGKEGTALSADADSTITIANGTTYRCTATLTATRDINLPTVGNGAVERIWIIFGHSGTFNYRLKDGATTVVTSPPGGTKGYCCVHWDGTNWRALAWDSSSTADVV